MVGWICNPCSGDPQKSKDQKLKRYSQCPSIFEQEKLVIPNIQQFTTSWWSYVMGKYKWCCLLDIVKWKKFQRENKSWESRQSLLEILIVTRGKKNNNLQLMRIFLALKLSNIGNRQWFKNCATVVSTCGWCSEH